jgi:hypothetical protein
MDQRVHELLELAAAEGLTLPMSPEVIIRLEDAGHVVNLKTGAIEVGEGDKPYVWAWTPAGEAVTHLVELGLLEV